MRAFTLLFAMAACAPLTSVAHEAGAFAFAGAGPSRTDLQCSVGAPCDKSTTAIVVGGGYRFASGFAFEGVGALLGETTGSIQGGSADVRTTALGGGVAYLYSFSPSLGAQVRLGLARMNTGVRFIASDGNRNGSVGDRYFRPYGGAELLWNASRTIAITAGATAWSTEAFGTSVQISTFALGASFRF